ncbi:uncharacterized protein LOC144642302 [Oculina patagonica]
MGILWVPPVNVQYRTNLVEAIESCLTIIKAFPSLPDMVYDIQTLPFFSKETLAVSNAKGDDKRSKNGGGHQPLNPLIIQALVGKVCSKFAKDSPPPSQVIQKINMKCVEAKRPPRVRVLTKNQE